MSEIWGAIAVFVLCPILGALPLVEWTTLVLAGKRLSRVGTGNISVSAAFYHGGRAAGIAAVLTEAFKGIAAVLLARACFDDPVWELVALIAIAIGRYWGGKGAGVTNTTWGIIVHDPVAAGLIALIGGISFTVLRDRRAGRTGILVLLASIVGLRHPNDPEHILAAVALAGLLGLIYQRIPDDLDLSASDGRADSQQMFRFFRGDRALKTLDDPLDPARVGPKAATLSQLKRWGYAVPPGWVLPPGDDPQPLADEVDLGPDNPAIARSSAIGEDSEQASAAGVYQSVSHLTSREALLDGILTCQAAYSYPTAAQYRRDRRQADTGIAVLVQRQIAGAFSGVAFSRDPVERSHDAVFIEGLPGGAAPIASGQATPQQYRARFVGDEIEIDGEGDLPPSLLREVAQLSRELEGRFHGIPQDVEWTFDGQQLWILQARPVTTLVPIWTRKIAAEVIPGAIAPLTWSINQPLTCGVWGDLFSLVLGDRVDDLDFTATATLHYSRAYFNATLLGQIFRRMGLPAESLEFLTRGTKFTRPPLLATLRNVPGLLRLARREWSLERDFSVAEQRLLAPLLSRLQTAPAQDWSPLELLTRIESILVALERTTYFNILAPLGFALRQTLLSVDETELDPSCTAEVASLQALAQLAAEARNLLPFKDAGERSGPSLFALLAETPDGASILMGFERWLDRYGYLSEAATDIAVPRWRDRPQPTRELFSRLLYDEGNLLAVKGSASAQRWQARVVQQRLQLKARVAETYNRLLAHLRWSFVALEQQWIESGILGAAGDIFMLEFVEVAELARGDDAELADRVSQLVQQRRSRLDDDRQLKHVPFTAYGQPPAPEVLQPVVPLFDVGRRWNGIAASPGMAIGRVCVLQDLTAVPDLDRTTILVVPHVDAGWAPLLAQAGGLIAEVGGRLSHGAILAREYGIPAVLDVPHATQIFQNGQRLRLDGQVGTVEILKRSPHGNSESAD
ncbi:glycerol-3-phosphate acyltransferase [Rubidibacter lacunae]|nr:glycerol-3-phosphate acyltransferase [Rubidibacter lacunae]